MDFHRVFASTLKLTSQKVLKQNTTKDDNTANYILFLSFTERNETDKLAINTFLQHSANPPFVFFLICTVELVIMG